jgi:RND family efflux transporter MFP subunit
MTNFVAEHRGRSGHHVKVFAILVTSLLLGAGCAREEKKPEDIRPVNAARVMENSAAVVSDYAGYVEPRYEMPLAFRISGKLLERDVDVGALVKRGQLLARLDTADQEANVASARAQVLSAESDYGQAKADYERFRESFAKKFISATEFDRYKTAYSVAAQRVEQARAQLKLTENQSAYTTLTANYDGVITATKAEAGQVVSVGETVVTLARPEEKEVAISVPENRLGELGAATDIRVSLWVNPSRYYEGKLREVSPIADDVTRTYPAKVTIVDPDDAVKLGMTATVFLTRPAPPHVVQVPLTALYERDAHPFVWVVDSQKGVVKLTPVTVGKYLKDAVTITSGLQPGELVVSAGVDKLIDGQKVRVLPEDWR